MTSGSVLDDPRLNVDGSPHLAHGQDRGRFREVGVRDELLYALSGDAEQRAYLCCSHDVQGPHHASQGTRRLTRPQARVHNQSARLADQYLADPQGDYPVRGWQPDPDWIKK